MIRQIGTDDIFNGHEYVPHAVLRRSPAELAVQLGITFEESIDDLDSYEIAALRLDDEPPFALMRYRGHPADETRLLLPHEPASIARTHENLARILEAIGLTADAISWRREPSPLH